MALLNKRVLAMVFSLAIALAFLLTSTPEVFSADKPIQWNLSVWGGSRAWTKPVEQWAKDMEKATNGRWKIKIHYGGVLAPAKEQLDGIRAGMFEAGGFCSAFHPGKNPLHTVAELPFIAPSNNKHIFQLSAALWEHPALKKELLKWNAVPLLPGGLCQYQLMGNKPVRTVEDLKGMRIRMGGEIGKVLRAMGAVPTMVPAPEVYEAVSRGTIDLVGFPWTYAYGSYKVHEVSKYAIVPIALGTMNCPFVASKDAWDALPEEFKKIHMKWYEKAAGIWADAYKQADDKWMPIFKKKLEFIEFPKSERDKIVAKAQGFYDKWIEAREKEGLPGREIYEYYLKKRKELTGN
ncbi:MAG: C4-dicarboxylate TRAP transporter substrate-binding protein [Deltaproteobacteria bacterium]|nr:C4-dicarboxylate TRAP transporter substrate-binding protein [Deltaproteobacteria bacterium]